MQETVRRVWGHDLVTLSSVRAAGGGDAAEELRAILTAMDERLRTHDSSLDDTVRTRLWAQDRESRDGAGKLRPQLLAGPARSASSSYICPHRLPPDARISLDLLAIPRPGGPRRAVEHHPPVVPIRYLEVNDLVVCSGITAVLPTLDAQMDAILERASRDLGDADTSWEEVVHIGFYHHPSVGIADVERAFRRSVDVSPPEWEFVAVDGYSAPGKLVEVEITARRR